MIVKWLILVLATMAGGASTARGESAVEAPTAQIPPDSKPLKEVRFEQRLNAQTPVDLRFRDDKGKEVTLRRCIGDKPAVFVLAYYRCPMLCNQVLIGLARSLKAIDFEPGEDFNVVVVSFDPNDTVELSASKKQAVVKAYSAHGGRSSNSDGWHFLTGDDADIKRLAESVGFGYKYDSKTDQYAHASGIMLLTPEGRVSKYFYGIEYPTRDVRLGLVEASAGRIGSPVDEILLYCFHYDPLTGRYGLAIMRLIRAGGILTVVGLIGFIATSLRRERRAQRDQQLADDLQTSRYPESIAASNEH